MWAWMQKGQVHGMLKVPDGSEHLLCPLQVPSLPGSADHLRCKCVHVRALSNDLGSRLACMHKALASSKKALPCCQQKKNVNAGTSTTPHVVEPTGDAQHRSYVLTHVSWCKTGSPQGTH